MNKTQSEALSPVPLLRGSSPGRLLVVDDDVAFLSPLCEFLSAAGYEVTGRVSGREALEAMDERRFDLLLADLVMPEMDGIALVRAAQERDPQLVSLVMTGQGSIQSAVDAMKAGAFDYLVKPLEFKMLDQVLARALDIRRLRMENRELRDAVEVFRLRQELQKAEEGRRILMENASDAIFMVDQEGVVLEVNRRARELTGYTKEELLGMHYMRLHPASVIDRVTAALEEGMGKGASSYIELPLLRKDGTTVPIDLVGVFIEHEGKRFGQVVVRDVSERKRSEEKVKAYQRELRSLASQISLAEERERRRIATNLHDGIGQTLALSKIKLGVLSESPAGDVRAEAVNEIRELIEQSIQYTRSLTSELSPPVLYELGFEAAVEALVEQMQKKHGIQIVLENDRKPKPVDEEVGVILFKAVRELIVNVVKHAQARRIEVLVRRNGDDIKITLRDDGVGFRSPGAKPSDGNAESGFGLFNIRERLESIGGGLEIKSEPGHGTMVAITAPLRHEGHGKNVT